MKMPDGAALIRPTVAINRRPDNNGKTSSMQQQQTFAH